MVGTAFSSAGWHALSSLLKLVTTTDIFHHFFLDFSKSIRKSSLLVLFPLKSQRNNMKLRKIQLNLEKYMCIIRIKLIAAANRLNITAADYGCSFVAKPNLEKKIFFLKKYLCFYKIFIFCRKSCFYMEKKFKMKKNFY